MLPKEIQILVDQLDPKAKALVAAIVVFYENKVSKLEAQRECIEILLS